MAAEAIVEQLINRYGEAKGTVFNAYGELTSNAWRLRKEGFESVINQYMATVRPSYIEFVEPSKRFADVIIPEGGMNTVALQMVIARLRGMLDE
jgi:hypothetical protein